MLVLTLAEMGSPDEEPAPLAVIRDPLVIQAVVRALAERLALAAVQPKDGDPTH